MENSLETILAFLLSVIIFFIFPIYIAYEKKDDLSYAAASKYVGDFVEEVKIKGYISTDMYQKLKERLATTGNTYDIYMEHRANKIYPVEIKDKNGNVTGYDYKEVKILNTEKQILPVICNLDAAGEYVQKNYYDENDKRIDLTVYRQINEEKISGVKTVDYENTKIENLPDIVPVFYIEDKEGNKEYIYTMNIGDEFTIRVKNNNISIAASLFDSLSTNFVDTDKTRVYINYGAVITSEKYWN